MYVAELTKKPFYTKGNIFGYFCEFQGFYMLRFPYTVIRGKLRGEWYARGIHVASMWPYATAVTITELSVMHASISVG